MGQKKIGGEHRVVKFICDEQLGRLARWLRLQGFDTRFESPIEDSRLCRLAQTEGRILLTRDHHLPAKTLWDAVVVIEEEAYEKQLRELASHVRLVGGRPFSRCLDCNEGIRPIGRPEVRGKVPEAVFKSYEEFFSCPSCKKIFWKGTHVKNSEARLRRLMRK